jgi:hypothetical protein
MARRTTWKQKLWALAAHWGIDEEPWLFDEFSDPPYVFDMTQVLLRLEDELKAAPGKRTLLLSRSSSGLRLIM